ncbi:MAG: PAS-domain containing protein [Hyphomicrobiales bacterium]
MKAASPGLQTVILAPIFAAVLVAGLALYLLVLRTVSDFAEASIGSNLSSLIANATTIVDSEVDRQNRDGRVGDASAALDYQLNARMRLEDFGRDQSVGVLIMVDGVPDFQTGIRPTDWDELMQRRAENTGKPIKLAGGNSYYVRETLFTPWNWSILVAKEARNFDSLINRVRAIYAGSAIGAALIAALLVYWLRRILVRPVNTIAYEFAAGRAPQYEGVKELEYLARSIGDMLHDVQAKNLHLQTTLESMSDGIAVFDRDLLLVFWNSQFARYYRYPPELMRQGMQFEAIMRYNIERGDYGPVDPEGQLREILERARTLNPPRFEIDRADGTSVEVRRARMPDGGFVTTYTDITDRKQRMLFEAANKAKSRFLENMSHDLRKPIASIIEDADALARRLPDAPRALHDIGANAAHLLTMIEEILDMSRIEAGQIEVRSTRTEIAPIMAQVARIAQSTGRAKGLTVTLSVDDGLVAETDGRLLSRILMNLASNAVEYTDSGEVRLTATRHGDDLIFTVADTGPGISRDKLGLIFEKFQRLQPTAGLVRPGMGLGLGLAISKQLAKLLKGKITVTSDVGHGSTFSLRIATRMVEAAV